MHVFLSLIVSQTCKKMHRQSEVDQTHHITARIRCIRYSPEVAQRSYLTFRIKVSRGLYCEEDYDKSHIFLGHLSS